MFTVQLSRNACALTARFLYTLASFWLPLIILASFGMYWPVHPSGMGSWRWEHPVSPTKPFQGIPYVPEGKTTPWRGARSGLSKISHCSAPSPAERGRKVPQSIKYSQVIPLFVNNVKGWITALVVQQSINRLSSVPLSEKQICADLLPSPMLSCDRPGCASLSWGLKDTGLGPSPQGRHGFPPPYPAGKASLH